ncbi:hypothetical protein [Virgibacillus senegalensis]|uniref:hypothetical protein n=1 Tax=Virgibacillus senegalensis TaxID=1499679 RepID=UPI00069E036B|nr:hypothetical protein [Virgibacillus senegalensis]
MLGKLPEDYFGVLRGPLESGRQSPGGLGGVLVIYVILQALMLFLEHFVGGYSVYPNKDIIFRFHFGISCIIAFLSVIYMIPAVYMNSQKFQYFLGIIASQNLFGFSFLIMAFLALGADITPNINSLVRLTFLTLGVGVLIFFSTYIRFYILLQKGEFCKGSKRDIQRSKLETKSYLPIVIIGSTGLVFILQYIMRNFDMAGFDTIVMVTVMIGLFYTMLFVLPEQLVILYCKYRFDSFNYEQNGRLKPLRDQSGNIINEIKDKDINYKALFEEMKDD